MPCLNEIAFIKLWLESASRYADELVIIDGGSTDGTREVIWANINKYNIMTSINKQQGQPYSVDWNESSVRNRLLNMATGDYILMLDADELMSDDFDKSKLEPDYFYRFEFIPFWRDIKTVRLSTAGDMRWLGHRIDRLFKSGQARYTDEKHHCQLISDYPIKESGSKIYHLHYALETFKIKPKVNDNRRLDMGVHNNINDAIDWYYVNTHPDLFIPFGSYKIETAEYNGEYPKILEEALCLKKI